MERVTLNKSFESVGVDFNRAIHIKDEVAKAMVKVYVCLFTCTSTRAVHLELAKNMSANIIHYYF